MDVFIVSLVLKAAQLILICLLLCRYKDGFPCYLFDGKQFYFYTVSIDISEISKISENSLGSSILLRQNGTQWADKLNDPPVRCPDQ